jgi:hypothetical protein
VHRYRCLRVRVRGLLLLLLLVVRLPVCCDLLRVGHHKHGAPLRLRLWCAEKTTPHVQWNEKEKKEKEKKEKEKKEKEKEKKRHILCA